MAIVHENDMHPNFAGDVPKSKGIPVFVQVLAVATLIGIFAIGTGVVFNAGFGHMWPAAQTQRVDLTKQQ